MATAVLQFRNAKLYMGRKLLGQLVEQKHERPWSAHYFEPAKSGEALGLVRVFAGERTTLEYVSDLLLAAKQITPAQWRAARRAPKKRTRKAA